VRPSCCSSRWLRELGVVRPIGFERCRGSAPWPPKDAVARHQALSHRAISGPGICLLRWPRSRGCEAGTRTCMGLRGGVAGHSQGTSPANRCGQQRGAKDASCWRCYSHRGAGSVGHAAAAMVGRGDKSPMVVLGTDVRTDRMAELIGCSPGTFALLADGDCRSVTAGVQWSSPARRRSWALRADCARSRKEQARARRTRSRRRVFKPGVHGGRSRSGFQPRRLGGRVRS